MALGARCEPRGRRADGASVSAAAPGGGHRDDRLHSVGQRAPPAARLGAYQASKFGLVGLAETLRIELAGDGIGVSIVYPSGMLTRHLESSAQARPAALGPGEVSDDDLTAMMASRPMTESDLTTADDAAERAVAGVLAGEPYVVTHGDLSEPVSARHAAIEAALDATTRQEAETTGGACNG